MNSKPPAKQDAVLLSPWWFGWGIFWGLVYSFLLGIQARITETHFGWVAIRTTAALLGIFFLVLELAYRGAIQIEPSLRRWRLSSLLLWMTVVALNMTLVRSFFEAGQRQSAGSDSTLTIVFLSFVVYALFALFSSPFIFWLGLWLLKVSAKLVRLPFVQRVLKSTRRKCPPVSLD